MIELEGVWKSYVVRGARKTVLKDVTTRFPTGRNVGILGVNGAGKSTLIRLLCAVEKPDRGVVRKNVRVSWPLGFAGGFQGSLTGRDNARFIARIYGASIGSFVAFARDFSELGDYFDMPVRSYSSGMKARFAFAVSLAADFDCYLVDEITAVGDQRFKDKYRKAFEERKAHASIVMVSHNPGTIRLDCDMGAVLHQGRLEMYEDVEAAIAEYLRLNDLPVPKVPAKKCPDSKPVSATG